MDGELLVERLLEVIRHSVGNFVVLIQNVDGMLGWGVQNVDCVDRVTIGNTSLSLQLKAQERNKICHMPRPQVNRSLSCAKV